MKMILSVALATTAAISVSSCKPEDVVASNYKKFQACVQSTSKDGLINKLNARNACSIKYSTSDFIAMEGNRFFNHCPTTACNTFAVEVYNKSNRHIITAINVTVTAKGLKYKGTSPLTLWIEPGSSYLTHVTLDQKLTNEDLEKLSWTLDGARGLEIDG